MLKTLVKETRINGGKRKNVNLKKKVKSNILLRLVGYKAMKPFSVRFRFNVVFTPVN